MDENQILLNKLMGRYSPDPTDREVHPIVEYKRIEMPTDERVTIDSDDAIEGTVGNPRELDK